MSRISDGGPAFPHREEITYPSNSGGLTQPMVYHHLGMTLRDWFAGKALQGSLADTNIGERNET